MKKVRNVLVFKEFSGAHTRLGYPPPKQIPMEKATWAKTDIKMKLARMKDLMSDASRGEREREGTRNWITGEEPEEEVNLIFKHST